MIVKDISPQDMRAWFRYEPETGRIFKRRDGLPAESRHCKGYLNVTIRGVSVLAHRAAWAISHGEWPKQQIDHINGDKTDNRLENLRDVSPSENNQNKRRAERTSTSGLLGVCWHKSCKKWHAQIRIDGRRISIGYFSDPNVAHAEYIKAKRVLHPAGNL